MRNTRQHGGKGNGRFMRRHDTALVTKRWWTLHRRFRDLVTLLTLLAYVTTATAGPVIMGGDDLTHHGSSDEQGQVFNGWLYIKKALQNLRSKVTRPGNDGSIAVLGSAEDAPTINDAGDAIGAAAAAAGIPVTYYDKSAGTTGINKFFTDLADGTINPAIIWLAGTGADNDLDTSEGQALTNNAQKIADFVNSGGGLMAHGSGPVAYGWLTTLMCKSQDLI